MTICPRLPPLQKAALATECSSLGSHAATYAAHAGNSGACTSPHSTRRAVTVTAGLPVAAGSSGTRADSSTVRSMVPSSTTFPPRLPASCPPATCSHTYPVKKAPRMFPCVPWSQPNSDAIPSGPIMAIVRLYRIM